MKATPLPYPRCLRKFSLGSLSPITLLVASAILLGASSFTVAQQMELREKERYNVAAFEKSKPAVGELAPNMELKTLAGKSVLLDSYRGKNIVVIKAGYT